VIELKGDIAKVEITEGFTDCDFCQELEERELRIPVVIKNIPEKNVHLGKLTREEFFILKVCDGMNTIPQVASISGKTVDEIEKMMEIFRKKGLVKVIKRII